ncbi:MAG: ABC transporter permease subunit [Oscillochloris sp.]|nr:ABC transporter permease subunit [Oscillochloris sp.]
MLINLIAAEWLKLSRRPLSLALLGAFLSLLLLYLGLWLLVVAFHQGMIGGVRLAVLNEAQLAELYRQLTFPGIFGAVLGQINGTGGIFAILLAAGSLGSDFSWGTLRVLLTRAPQRGQLLLAKLIVLLLALLAGALIGLAVGALLALIAGAILGAPLLPGPRDLLVLPLGVARSLLVLLPYTMIAFAAAAFGRSTLAGVGGGMAFLAIDVSAGSLGALGAANDLLLLLVNLLLQPNINALVVANSRLYGLDPTVLASGLDLATLPGQAQAVLVIGLYCALAGYGAYRALARRDIGGAA